MSFYFCIAGYGFGFQVGGYDAVQLAVIIWSWRIVKNHLVWRGETHSRFGDGYHYRCVKNGIVVEDISLRSPIVSNSCDASR